MIKTKKLLCAVVAAALAASVFTACGKNNEKNNDKKNNADNADSQSVEVKLADPDSTPYIAQEIPSKFKAGGGNITEAENGGVQVALDTREGEESHEFITDDLGFVDTYNGALIKIGMSADEIESLVGQPKYVDSPTIRYYNGIVVNYDNDLNAEQIVVAAGNMEEEDDPGRFVTPRGVGIGASLDDFKSVYGEEYTEPSQAAEGDTAIRSSATMAVRYYAKDGDSFNYLGESYTRDNKPENDNDLIMQTFLFATETNDISVISIKRGTDVN